MLCVLQSVYQESKEGTRNAGPQKHVEENERYYPHHDPAHEPYLLSRHTGLLCLAVDTQHGGGASAPRHLNGERLLLYGGCLGVGLLYGRGIWLLGLGRGVWLLGRRVA